MDEWTDGWTDRSPCVLQDFVPFGAAALLPLNLNHSSLKQGMGTAAIYFFSVFELFEHTAPAQTP